MQTEIFEVTEGFSLYKLLGIFPAGKGSWAIGRISFYARVCH
jgi:hypothetical protein